MVDDARIEPGAAAYRGFLFADLRGFTAFAERHGNAAAAAMVGRFFDVARSAIARHQGADTNTEGDAIHAVFASASSAVLCGLDIVDAAAALNAQEPDRPLNLGVGVHAGEAVETAEGYIGRAVNIAARLCAAARPGEVLVSSTVKGITQASIPVGFIPRGRRRLKGIQDPIVVYAVTRDMTAKAPRALPGPALLGIAGVAAAAVVAILAIAGSQLLSNVGGGPAVTAAPSPQPVAIGPLPIGRYVSQAFQPPLTFGVGDLDWIANRDQPEMLGLIREVAPRGSVFFLRVTEVLADPCVQGGEGSQTGPGAADLLTELEGLTYLTLSARQPASLGGFSGEQLDVTVSNSALAACAGLVGGDVAVLRAGDEVWRASAGERFRLVSVDVADEAVTVLMSTEWTETQSVQEFEDLVELGQRILDSVEF